MIPHPVLDLFSLRARAHMATHLHFTQDEVAQVFSGPNDGSFLKKVSQARIVATDAALNLSHDRCYTSGRSVDHETLTLLLVGFVELISLAIRCDNGAVGSDVSAAEAALAFLMSEPDPSEPPRSIEEARQTAIMAMWHCLDCYLRNADSALAILPAELAKWTTWEGLDDGPCFVS